MTDETVPSFDGTNLHVRQEGRPDGPAVLLSHAVGTTLEAWDALVPLLSPRFRVIRYDTRGHGRSQAPEGPYAVEMLGRDALAILARLGIERASFIGLSQGGMTGMWLAAHHPQTIERLVVANTAAYIPVKDIWPGLIETALRDGMQVIGERTIKSWLGPTYQAAEPQGVEALVAAMQRMSPFGYAGACAMLRDVDLRGDLERIRCPTLVIAGLEDGPAGAAAAQALNAGISHARRIDLPRSAHLSPIENPAAFNRAVVEFLA